jgi:MerR family transcriptional regulator, aldehyde-responsive regulator
MEDTMEFYIKEAAEKVGLPASTLRYYEQEGLLPLIKRDENGNRIFDETDLSWIELIVCFRKTDLALSELRAIVELTKEGESTARKRKQIFEKHKEKMMEKQRDLDIAFKKIETKIEYYDELEKKYHKENENMSLKA